ncbi:Ribonucleoside-diphosphate reductase 1 subunit alpha [Planctomycetes bacterium Pla86]|uniref:Ribonucleoside-diphosphate reductase n=2 Tax=Engelhardtia mirabilis TaxID=2528011 RepID=A0A518BP02_9BACT|nr:Ribonucleoside-diphosphate reductase 1 subunit alpha [Planctomycetes bacterium Pla133]QDV03035.1 Ribonucleoside-diphosphate reductase 1 subunit alpha [Planctomycetes bacterium Pla86]
MDRAYEPSLADPEQAIQYALPTPDPGTGSMGSGEGSAGVTTPEAVGMRVRKRNGGSEPVDVNKIVRAVQRCGAGLDAVDPLRVATRTISGLYDGATTSELDRLSIQTAASLIAEEPQYSKLAARLLGTYIDKEVANQDIMSFSQSIKAGVEAGLISERVAEFVQENQRKLNDAIDPSRVALFEYFGLRTVYDRYLLKDPHSRDVLETPQYFFMRVACGLAQDPAEAIEFYHLISSLVYLPSSPTLFNSGSQRTQLSSCYLLDSPEDDLTAIYRRYNDVAQLSKFAGGIGLAYHRIRSKGSLIRGTNGHSNGIVPWLKTLDSSVAAVNQGGRRKGAACVYLESWHADIEDFLELRDNTGDDARRTHNLNLANWVPDLFMKRVEAGEDWSLFDPKVVPHFTDIYGEEFERAYEQAEAEGLASRKVPARELYGRMMRTLAQTGNGWMTFKDASNRKCNQTGAERTDGKPSVVHLSNLCTEIIEVTSQGETAVCNLGSINIGRFVVGGEIDYVRLRQVARIAMRYLDRVIDINYYPTAEAKSSNQRWRPVGLGLMGLQDVFFKLGLPFDSERARALSRRVQEEIYFAALDMSCELAEELGAHPAFDETRAAVGKFQWELWDGVEVEDPARWDALRERIKTHGLRNSLMLAIAPTATIASIAGCYECIEPQISNLFKRETLSGDFLQINNYLVLELKKLGKWTPEMRQRIKNAEGSIQSLEELPAELRAVFRTAWEVPQRSLIDMAAERGAFIDQSQSLNLFMETPTIGKLSSMYLYAWKQGLKTTYYLRSRPATRIRQTDSSVSAQPGEADSDVKDYSDNDAVVCSLENPESCEACQ